MAPALANLTNVQKQVISILGANPASFASTVATSPVVGAYPSDPEILLAILQSDESVCTDGYFQSVNDALANPFNVTTAPLANRANIPFHRGDIDKVEVAQSAKAFTCTVANTLTITAHGYTTGQLVTAITTGTLPTGMAVLTNYYVIVVDNASIKLATTFQNAVAGSNISITQATGSGVHTLIAWVIGIEAKNLDDITNAIAVGNTYVQDGAFDFLYKEDSGTIYTPADYVRLTYPEYVRTSTLQSYESEEFLVTCGAVRRLVKNASPAPFTTYVAESYRGIQQLVQDGQYTMMATKQAGGEPA